MINNILTSFFYERLNHLGNVQVVVSDKRISVCDSELEVEYFKAEVLSAVDYYCFGMMMPDRQWYANNDSGIYKFAFNGKEIDREHGGAGNVYDYGFRIYNPALGKFLSVDPLTDDYPSFSSYQFAGNSPIKFIDLDGLEMYVKGTMSDEYVNLLSQLTGLELSRNSATGQLTYATVDIGDPELGCGKVPKINNPNSDKISAQFRRDVIQAIDGGKKQSPVTIIAMSRDEIKAASGSDLDLVLFDIFGSTPEMDGIKYPELGWAVDMTDFLAIKTAPALQATIMDHIIVERMNAGKGFTDAHEKALVSETKVLQDYYPKATLRDESKKDLNIGKGAAGMKDTEAWGTRFDYGDVIFNTIVPYEEGGMLNESEIIGVKEYTK